jgi:hypothetical protein
MQIGNAGQGFGQMAGGQLGKMAQNLAGRYLPQQFQQYMPNLEQMGQQYGGQFGGMAQQRANQYIPQEMQGMNFGNMGQGLGQMAGQMAGNRLGGMFGGGQQQPQQYADGGSVGMQPNALFAQNPQMQGFNYGNGWNPMIG